MPVWYNACLICRCTVILLYYTVKVKNTSFNMKEINFLVLHRKISGIYIFDPQIEWKIISCCYHCDISGFSLPSVSLWRGNMKYHLRKALITLIWLLCSFQVAQLWLDPTIIARSSVMELALISIVMVIIVAAFHWGITRAIKFWYAYQRIHSLNLIHNLRSLICQA